MRTESVAEATVAADTGLAAPTGAVIPAVDTGRVPPVAPVALTGTVGRAFL